MIFGTHDTCLEYYKDFVYKILIFLTKDKLNEFLSDEKLNIPK